MQQIAEFFMFLSGKNVQIEPSRGSQNHFRTKLNTEGGFYSAEDADSVPPEQAANPTAHKSDGAFYIWTDAEIGDVTGIDAAIVRRRYGIEPDGNAPQDPQGEFRGRNLLHVAQSVDDIAARTGHSPEDVVDALGRARAELFAVRERRPRPHLDDKVLTAWNGLMIAAFARAARVLAGSPAASRYLAAGRRAAEFVRRTLWIGAEQRLLRRYRDGEAAIDGYAETTRRRPWASSGCC